MDSIFQQFLLTEYNNCTNLIIHHNNLRQSLLRLYFAFIGGVFILLGFIISLVASGEMPFGRLLDEIIKNYDTVGGMAMILVIFVLCLGVCCLYIIRNLTINNIKLFKTISDIRQAFSEGVSPAEAEKYILFSDENKVKGRCSCQSSNIDTLYARILIFSNSMFLLCLTALMGLYAEFSRTSESGLVFTMALGAVLAIIFYFIQLEFIYSKPLMKLAEKHHINNIQGSV